MPLPLPPGSNWNQGSAAGGGAATSALARSNSNSSNNASPHGYLTPGRPSPLSSPLTAAPTSFVSPRVPQASPGPGGGSPRVPGNPFSPSTPGLHSPVGGAGGGGGGGDGGGGSTASFFLSSPAAQRQAKPPTEEDSAKANARPNQPSLDSNGSGAEASNAPSPRPLNPNPSPAPQCPASHSTLTERHKILHRLLQDTSPNEASAAGEDGAGRAAMEVKKEPPASPATASAAPKSREPQDHQLLRFLLDTDEKVSERPDVIIRNICVN